MEPRRSLQRIADHSGLFTCGNVCASASAGAGSNPGCAAARRFADGDCGICGRASATCADRFYCCGDNSGYHSAFRAAACIVGDVACVDYPDHPGYHNSGQERSSRGAGARYGPAGLLQLPCYRNGNGHRPDL